MRIDAFFLYEGLNKQLSGKFRAACSASATHSLVTSQALDRLNRRGIYQDGEICVTQEVIQVFKAVNLSKSL